ncbi:MAG: hypothetical protein UV73_C0003G0200 [Candidatus Gottesmanbacteria bacterium GW2011_GWA2_43_14]|uniref:PsbP C-terminal domain-containing protein n=1 Tax=Candidatus Gottesmanbacteria bacterium GW2011_GWA2_43_14 TaxID=1618443 RepID=A0A0G1GHJ1_9BACT|nr:MAG: hypothetical protein UV73_C0003G0200 [Candidatus Gottesmanbacteria bacterium GW2011_GWA2_43_14]
MNKYRYLILSAVVIAAILLAGLAAVGSRPPVSPEPEIATVSSIVPTETQSGWKTFSDPEADISFQYPDTWEVRTDGQNFQEGDLFAMQIWGETQKTQTELYDGASFAVMNPIVSDLDAEAWVQQKYNVEPQNTVPTEFTEVTLGRRVYQKVLVCGLGCFSYHHIKENGKIYGFVFLADGPDADSYIADFVRIMESVSYSG